MQTLNNPKRIHQFIRKKKNSNQQKLSDKKPNEINEKSKDEKRNETTVTYFNATQIYTIKNHYYANVSEGKSEANDTTLFGYKISRKKKWQLTSTAQARQNILACLMCWDFEEKSVVFVSFLLSAFRRSRIIAIHTKNAFHSKRWKENSKGFAQLTKQKKKKKKIYFH